MRKRRFFLISAVFLLLFGLGALAASNPWKTFFPQLLPFTGEQKRPMAEMHIIEPTPGPPPDAAPAQPENEPGGAVSEPLPWTAGDKLETLKLRHDTPVLIAAYCATLLDPILAEQCNIRLAADLLAGTVVPPGEIFSQNNRIGPYTKARGFKDGPMYAGSRLITSEGGGVCKIASLLYNVVILANLPVVERHPHSMTVPYVPPGQDATVAYGVCDFRFKNTNSGPILIWSEMIGNTLYIAFYGQKPPPPVKWHHKIIRRSKFSTEYRYNPSLPPGTERVLVTGLEGIVVHTWLTIETERNTIRRDLGIDYYQPCPRVVERGPMKKPVLAAKLQRSGYFWFLKGLLTP